jgi:hypothetical protein
VVLVGVWRQAIDHIINSAAKTNYMSGGTINVPIVFRGPNGAAAGVAAQHSQVILMWRLWGGLLSPADRCGGIGDGLGPLIGWSGVIVGGGGAGG